MKKVPDLDKATAVAATGQTRAAAAPRLKLSPQGFAIDHPDPELGAALMAETLGVTDRDAMYGILTQLVKAGVNKRKPDAVNLAFMIAMVESIKPRDSIEAMLVAQMVSVHVMATLELHQSALGMGHMRTNQELGQHPKSPSLGTPSINRRLGSPGTRKSVLSGPYWIERASESQAGGRLRWRWRPNCRPCRQSLVVISEDFVRALAGVGKRGELAADLH